MQVLNTWSKDHMQQQDLFNPMELSPSHRAILMHYAGAKALSVEQGELYAAEAMRMGMRQEDLKAREPVGKSRTAHSVRTRQIRWWQQDLKARGWIERVPQSRGRWRLTEPARKALTEQAPGRVMLGVSTELGIALWASAEDVYSRLDEPITLILTSPPYALARPRAYGNVKQEHYVGWLVETLTPLIRRLRPGGTLALNVSNDIFEPGSPARSIYREKLVIALCETLGLHKWDEFIWHNPSKAPGPIQWASLSQQQLNVAWEPVYIFTNDPHRCVASNRRVLQQHTEQHLRLMSRGGEDREGVFSDGAYRVRPGAYGRVTPGRIPRNLQSIPHRGSDPALEQAKKRAAREGLPVHGAPMPLALADFMVRYLSEAGDLVADPFGGWGTTGFAAEANGRRWICTEKHLEYVLGTGMRFEAAWPQMQQLDDATVRSSIAKDVNGGAA